MWRSPMAADVRVAFITPHAPEFHEAKRLRYSVLYEPLGIPESAVDWDDYLPGTHHCIVLDRGDLVGYGRLVIRAGEAQIRHLAVSTDRRGRGIGATLLDALLARARELGARMVFLNARFTALGMYRSRGFEPIGPVFHSESTHLPHQRMEHVLS